MDVLFGIEKFRGYIEDSHFTIITDHANIKRLKKLANSSGRLAKFLVKLRQFDFDIVHVVAFIPTALGSIWII